MGWPFALAVLVVAFVGCAGGIAQQRADGSYVLDCSDQKACLQRAKRTCGDEGYLIVGGKSNKKRYGAPGNEIFIGKEEMYIRCNRDRPKDAPDLVKGGEWELSRRERSNGGNEVKPVAPSQPQSAVVQICRPGVTQRCVGPGACEGGQACLLDGSAFGPCDCGLTPPGPKASDAAASDAGVVNSAK